MAKVVMEQALNVWPQTRFYIFDKSPSPEKKMLPRQTTYVPVPQVLKGVLLPGILQKQRLAAHIKKHEIKKLWAFSAPDIVKTNLHQTLINNNEHDTSADIMQNIEKCNSIISFSRSYKQKLQHLRPALAQKITVATPVVQPGFQPLPYNDRLAAKEQFAAGKEYFVSADFEMNTAQFINLLRAFSAFKKMQQTNWKLVVCLRRPYAAKEKEDLLQPLASFKFRGDVVMIHSQSESDIQESIAGAYAMISVSEKSIYPLPVLEGMLCHIPVITLQSADKHPYNNALIITNESTHEHLAQQMMAIYKDEKLRNWLSKKAGESVAGFDVQWHIEELVKLIV